ncbi:MAG: hypothetical protein RL758_1585 [Pseudomonadota bacterium]
MKVLDLNGACGHVFEGWFGSEEDFLDQLSRGLLECPVCGDRQVTKRLSAPRLNLARNSDPTPPASRSVQVDPPHSSSGQADGLATVQAAWWRAVRTIAARTEDVGDEFAQEARRIHHGKSPARDIRGRATLDEAQALLEEGLEVLPLPDLPVFKTNLQ